MQNIEDAQFCRGCGANISLVPQALVGQTPESRAVGYDVEGQPYDASGRRIRRDRDRTPRIEKAIPNIFIGLAFLTIAIILGFKGQDWWYWLLIPAFGLFGGGIAEIARYKQASEGREGAAPLPPKQAKASAVAPPPRVSALPQRDTSELVQPPSVTEGTTRHLNIKTEAPTQRVNKQAENQGRET